MENDLFDIFSSQENGATSSTAKDRNSASFANSFDPLASLKTPATTVNTNESESNTNNSNNKVSSNDRYAALSDLFMAPSTSGASAEVSAPTALSTTELNVLPLPPKTNTESLNAFSLSTGSLSKSMSSTSIIGTNSFSVYKPLSKSFASSYSQSSNGIISRADSVSSLSSDFRMTPISLCSSRDSSPLTIGMSDTVPIAIAFQESVGACFKGADENLCRINVIGCIKIAFSSGIIQVCLSFCLVL